MSTQIEKLTQLASLKDRGILSEEEFSEQKTKLLNEVSVCEAVERTKGSVNNGAIWTLTFAPIIGLFLEYFFAGMFYGDTAKADRMVESGSFFWVTIGLNILCSYLDENKLRSLGHDTSQFRWSTFLVPVYLFKRSELLNDSRVNFILWIVCFIFNLSL